MAEQHPTHPSPPINLLKGQPNPSLLPIPHLHHATALALTDPSISHSALAYGPDPGYSPLRTHIADWLAWFYNAHLPRSNPGVSASRICITGGASQNLGNVLNVYTDPAYTRNIWIVAPGYFLAFRIFEDAGFAGKMRAVPEDGEGLDVQFLRREMRESERRAAAGREDDDDDVPRFKPRRDRAKVFKHVVYCVPTFANPSSRSMSVGRRRELVGLAREFDGLVVADDVYDFLWWGAGVGEEEEKRMGGETAKLPRLVDVDRELEGGTERKGADGFGNACSNGSFSKIAGPGIRVGWVEGSEKFAYGMSQTGTTCSGGAPSQLTSTYVDQLFKYSSLEPLKEASQPQDCVMQTFISRTLQPAHASRYRQMMAAIETHLVPLGFTLPQSDRSIVGGYFTWLGLPDGLLAEALASSCKKEAEVIIAPGSLFEVPGDDSITFRQSVRLCWAWEEEARLQRGVELVAGVAKRMLHDSEGGEYVVVEKSGQGVAEFK